MKKSIVSILIFAAMMPVLVFAQSGNLTQERKIVNGGIKLQANTSNLIIRGLPNNMKSSMNFGGEFGGFIDFNVTKHFVIQMNLMLPFESCKIKENADVNNLYQAGIEIPLYFLGRFGSTKSGYFYFGGGPYTEFIVWARYKTNNESFNPYHHVVGFDDETGDDILAMSDNHSGMGICIGYEFPFGLQINASYQCSYSDILAFEHGKLMSVNPQKVIFGLGWRF